MADISNPTVDVSIMDNSTGNLVPAVLRRDSVYALAVSDKDDRVALFEQGRLFSTTSNVVTVGAASETPVFLLRNPTASTMTMHLFRISVDAASDASNVFIRLYKNATVTANGTTIGINNMNADGTYTAQALASISPTVSANGTLYRTWVFVRAIGNSDNGLDLGGLCTLKPNENIMLTMASGKDKDFTCCVIFAEAPRT
jgi:hypothetical protein